MSDEQDKIGEAIERLTGGIAIAIQAARLQASIKDEPLTYNDVLSAIVPELALVEQLIRDVARIANESQLPDGDGVNVSTALWAEDWLRRFEKENQ